MSVCLAIMAKASPAQVLRAIESAKAYADSVCLVVAPGDPLRELELPLPGRIVEEPWRGFAATRTATLRHAEAAHGVELVLMLDADDAFAAGGVLPSLEDPIDAWSIPVDHTWPEGRWRWTRAGHVIRARSGCSWSGEVHEGLTVPSGRVARWDGLVYLSGPATGRSWEVDAGRLRAELERAPENTRAAFYRAQSLKDGGSSAPAIAAFLERAAMGGFDEEVFWAWLWAAKLAACVPSGARAAYALAKRAHEHSPHRAEPLRLLALASRRLGREGEAERLDELADALPYPHAARLFVDVLAYAPGVRP